MIYTFKNNKTGKVFEKTMKMAEKESYLKAHPDLSLVITPVAMSYRGHVNATSRMPDALNDRLTEIKKTVPKEFANKIDTK